MLTGTLSNLKKVLHSWGKAWCQQRWVDLCKFKTSMVYIERPSLKINKRSSQLKRHSWNHEQAMGMETLICRSCTKEQAYRCRKTQNPTAKEQVTQLRNGQPAYIRHFPKEDKWLMGMGKGSLIIRRYKSKPENDIVSSHISVSTKKTEVLVSFYALSYTEYTYYNHYENPYRGSS